MQPTARSLALVATVVLAFAACGGSGSGNAGAPTTTTSTTRVSAPGTAASCAPGIRRTVAYRHVAGVPAAATSLDVFPLARGCDAPVVMWVHGGGYRTGDKSNAVAPKVRWARTRGWVFVSVNYRLTDPADPTGAHFPDHYEDVAAAIAWVHRHIVTFGGDPGRLAVLGHSAGADIVANVLVDPTYLRADGLDLDSVACGAPLDTEGFDKVRAGAADPDGEREQWKVALGNQPDYLTRTSATRNVHPGIGIPPMIGVVRGTARRRSIERGFLTALRDAGVAAAQIDARGLTHEQVNRRIGAPGDEVMTPPLTRFLTDCFTHR